MKYKRRIKINFLIVTHYFPPINSIASLRPYSFAKYWADAGHSVTVLTTRKSLVSSSLQLPSSVKVVEIDYPLLRFLEGYKADSSASFSQGRSPARRSVRNLLGNAVRYLRSRFGILAAERIPEVLMGWTFSAKRYVKANISEFDAIVCEYSPPSALSIGAYAKRIGGDRIKVVFDYRDSWTESNYSQAGVPGLRRVEAMIERRYLHYADLLVGVQRGITMELSSKNPKARSVVVENGYFDDIEPEHIELEAEKFHVVYTGNYGGYRSLEFILDVLEILKLKYPVIYDEIQFHILGEGAFEGSSDKVFLKGKLPLQVALGYQRASNVLLLVESPEEIARYNIPGKLFEYYRFNKPIIAVGPKADFEIARYLERNDIGVVSSCDPAEFCTKLISIYEDNELLSGRGLDAFSRKRKAEDLLSKIEGML